MDNWMPFTNGPTEEKPGTQELKKLSLQKQIVEIFYTQGHKTIADLCVPAQVSIPTMTSIMNELIDEGWVKRFGIVDSRGDWNILQTVTYHTLE